MPPVNLPMNCLIKLSKYPPLTEIKPIVHALIHGDYVGVAHTLDRIIVKVALNRVYVTNQQHCRTILVVRKQLAEIAEP